MRTVSEDDMTRMDREEMIEGNSILARLRHETLTKNEVLFLVSFEFFRAYMLGVTLIILSDYMSIQMHTSQTLSLINLIILINYRPMDDTQPSTNKMKLFAESCLFILHYIMFLYTDYSKNKY
jgi:hypothetical protein